LSSSPGDLDLKRLDGLNIYIFPPQIHGNISECLWVLAYIVM